MRNFLVFTALVLSFEANSQSTRVNDFNNTNWLQMFATVKLDKQWSVHAEYQWRREDGFKYWQQGLTRVGLNYKINDAITAHVGYAFVETFPYGDYPIAAAGTFSEHRIYEQLTAKQVFGKLNFTNRFRVEQRWLERIQPDPAGDLISWVFSHRFRYQARVQYPFLPAKARYFYAAAADEVFINAGKNVGVNTFDQNRVFLLFGYKINNNLSLEGGYFNQTLMQGKKVNDNMIMQRNNGFLLGTFISL